MIKKIVDKVKNYHPAKPLLFLFFFIPIMVASNRAIVLDNDIWFLLNTGKEIMRHGFIRIEPFTIHEKLEFVVQQWLTDIIFYFTHSIFGGWGLYILTMFLFIIILFVAYKLCMLVSNKKQALSVMLSCIIGFLYTTFYVRSRPQMFDFIIFLIEFYLLESYIRKNNNKYLYFLPILSLFLINLHASVWFMFFVFIIPYLIGACKIQFLCFESDGYKSKPIFIAMLISFLVGFINPYGIDAITYLFTSYNNSYINVTVNEMRAYEITSIQGLLIHFIIFLVILCFLINKKKNINIRYFLLFIGTAFLALSSLKGFSYFITASIFFLGDYFSEYFRDEFSHMKYNQTFKIQYVFSVFLLIIMIVVFTMVNYINFNKQALTKIVDYLEKDLKVDKKNTKIYTGYDDGSYAEYRGLKVYIDPRAEVFLKSNNKKKDIYKEYYELQHGQYDIEKFLKQYDFDYLIILEKDFMYKYYLNTEKNTTYKKIMTSQYLKNKRYLYQKIE